LVVTVFLAPSLALPSLTQAAVVVVHILLQLLQRRVVQAAAVLQQVKQLKQVLQEQLIQAVAVAVVRT
jgi:hypothetical protein